MKERETHVQLSTAGYLVWLLLLLPTFSYASDFSDSFLLNGFFTLDASLSEGGDARLPTPSGEPTILDEGKVNFDGSLLGLQADYHVTDSLKLTAQGLFSKQADNKYDASLEWAYLTYDPGQDLYIRGGKLKLPFLSGTELRYVGYSRLWVRPLVSSNGAGGFDDYKGAEVIKNSHFGDYNLKFHGAYGIAEHDKSFIENDDVKLLSARVEKNESWLNLSLLNTQYDVYTPDKLTLIQKNANAYMASMEAELLYQNAIFNLGYVYGDAEVSPDERMAYLSLGYRATRFTPYLLYQHRLMRFDLPDLPPPPPGPLPPPPTLRPKDGDERLNVYSLGMRYDIGATYALKAQLDRQIVHDDTNPLAGGIEHDTTLCTIVLEGVF